MAASYAAILQALQQANQGGALQPLPGAPQAPGPRLPSVRAEDPDFLQYQLMPLQEEEDGLMAALRQAQAFGQPQQNSFSNPWAAGIGALTNVVRAGVSRQQQDEVDRQLKDVNQRRVRLVEGAGQGPSKFAAQGQRIEDNEERLRLAGLRVDQSNQRLGLQEDRQKTSADQAAERLKLAQDRLAFQKEKAAGGATAAAEKAAKKAEDDRRDLEASFRKEVLQGEQGKKYIEAKTQFETLKSLSENPTPANSMAIVFAAMKALDPDSVVKEGEQVQVRNTTNLPGQLLNYFQRVSTGNGLNAQQVSEILDMAQRGLYARAKGLSELSDAYRPIVEGAGGNMRNVMPLHLDLEEPVSGKRKPTPSRKPVSNDASPVADDIPWAPKVPKGMMLKDVLNDGDVRRVNMGNGTSRLVKKVGGRLVPVKEK